MMIGGGSRRKDMGPMGWIGIRGAKQETRLEALGTPLQLVLYIYISKIQVTISNQYPLKILSNITAKAGISYFFFKFNK